MFKMECTCFISFLENYQKRYNKYINWLKSTLQIVYPLFTLNNTNNWGNNILLSAAKSHKTWLQHSQNNFVYDRQHNKMLPTIQYFIISAKYQDMSYGFEFSSDSKSNNSVRISLFGPSYRTFLISVSLRLASPCIYLELQIICSTLR